MTMTKGMYSTGNHEWETPQELFDQLSKEFGGFNLDPCATADNAKCEHYFTKEQDGLTHKWMGHVFMNPPYGRAIGDWVRKAYASAGIGALVVCLLPARTDTSWFHDYCMKGEIRFLRGRLKFGHSKNSAPFPSMIVIFRPRS